MILDLTHPFDSRTLYWPGEGAFARRGVIHPRGVYYSTGRFAAAEHGGTHADAPAHFAKGGRTIGGVPLRDWIGPAAKIDASDRCARDRDFMLGVPDVRAWERRNGRLPRRAWVLMRTGFDRFYPDREKVLGTSRRGKRALDLLRFPGFSPEAAAFLLRERGIAGLGIDTPSVDRGRSKDFQVHRLLCGAGKPGLENLARLDKLPARGAVLFAAPMLIREGTGAPARVFALLP
jgi:kynurenine formamidase